MYILFFAFASNQFGWGTNENFLILGQLHDVSQINKAGLFNSVIIHGPSVAALDIQVVDTITTILFLLLLSISTNFPPEIVKKNC